MQSCSTAALGLVKEQSERFITALSGAAAKRAASNNGRAEVLMFIVLETRASSGCFAAVPWS